MAIAVPSGPAFPRNVLPGITKAPQPMIHPKAKDHTFKGDSFFSSCMSFSIANIPFMRITESYPNYLVISSNTSLIPIPLPASI